MYVLVRLILLLAFLPAGTATARDWWGAFAYDPTNGGFGAAVNYDTARAAIQAALDVCGGQHAASRCQVVGAAFNNLCGALVIGDRGAAYAATDDYQRDALALCRENGGHSCRIAAVKCNNLSDVDHVAGQPSVLAVPPELNWYPAHRGSNGSCYNTAMRTVPC